LIKKIQLEATFNNNQYNEDAKIAGAIKDKIPIIAKVI